MSAESGAGVDAPQYRIGVAARLSGVATHTLRKWEERYGVVTPSRTPSGERMYSEGQVRYLSRLKALVDAGLEISHLARMSTEELDTASENLLARPSAAVPGRGESPRPRVLVIGPEMPAYFERHAHGLRKLDVKAVHPEPEDLDPATEGADLLICEQDTVHGETGERVEDLLEACGARAGVVLYRFGPRWALDALRSPSVSILRMPVEPADLQRLALGTWYDVIGWPQIALGPDDGSRSGGPRFSEAELMRISSAPSVAMLCECPHHIADLLLDLTAFERYSAECEVQQPEDAAEHRFLRATAASARILFEEALARIAGPEGLLTGPRDA